MEIKKCVCLVSWQKMPEHFKSMLIQDIQKAPHCDINLSYDIRDFRYAQIMSELSTKIDYLCDNFDGDFSSIADTSVLDDIVEVILKSQKWEKVITNFFSCNKSIAFDPENGKCIDIDQELDQDVIVIIDGEVFKRD